MVRCFIVFSLIFWGSFSVWGQAHIIEQGTPPVGQEVWAWDSIQVISEFHYRPESDTARHHLFIDKDGEWDLEKNPDEEDANKDLNFPSELDRNRYPANYSGSYTVDMNGQFNYQLPFAVPSGINGLTPNLGMHYVSSAQEGLLGRGWNLTGIPSITRENYNRKDHNKAGFAERNSNTLYLSGRKLHRGDNNEWFLSVADPQIIKIKQSGSRFHIYKKNGHVEEYGGAGYLQTSTGDDQPPTNSTDRTWGYLLKKISDQDGNTMLFEYSTALTYNLRKIKKIQYAGNPSQNIPYQYSIEFFYNTFSGRSLFREGRGVSYGRCLNEIRVEKNHAKHSGWKFAYTSAPYRNYLKNIEHTLSAGAVLNTIEFQYDYTHASGSVLSDYDEALLSPISENVILDHNGDGYSDIVTFAKNSPELSPNGPRYQFMILKSRKTYADEWEVRDHVVFQSGFPYDTDDYTKYTHRYKVGDFNGDGKDDIIVFVIEYDSGDHFLHGMYFFYGTSDGFSNGTHLLNLRPGNHKFHYADVVFGDIAVVGDFNANGSTDMILNLRSGTYFQDFSLNGLHFRNGNRMPQRIAAKGIGLKSFFSADVNGDGYLDVVYHSKKETGWYQLKYTQTSSFAPDHVTDMGLFGDPSTRTDNQDDHAAAFLDYNRDGILDIYWQKKLDLGKAALTLQGNRRWMSGTSLMGELNTQGCTPSGKTESKVGDFNGDGWPDLVHLYYHGEAPRQGHTLLFQFNDQGRTNAYSVCQVLPAQLNNPQMYLGDFDGNGKLEVLCMGENNRSFRVGFDTQPSYSKMTAFSDAFKNTWNIDYQGVTVPLCYDLDQPSVRKLHTNVVQQIQSQRIDGRTLDENYTLYGLKYHAINGSLGCQRIDMEIPDPFTANSSNPQQIALTQQVFTYIPLLKTSIPTETLLLKKQTQVSRNTLTYSTHLNTNDQVVHRLVETEQHDYLRKLTTTTRIEPSDYDAYGNVLRSVRTHRDNNNGNTVVVAHDFQNFEKHNGALTPNFATLQKTTTTYLDAPSEEHTVRYLLNDGRIAQKFEFEGSPKARTTTYGYNALGLIDELEVEAFVDDQNTKKAKTWTEYAPHGLFVEKRYEDLDYDGTLNDRKLIQKTTAVHPLFLLPTQVEDRFGNRTTNEYDAAGQLTSTTLNGTFTTTTHTTWDLGSQEDANIFLNHRKVLRTTTTETASPDRYVTTDVAGRPTKECVEQDGKFYCTNYSYSLYDRWKRHTEVVEENGLYVPVYSTNYDDFGRRVSAQSAGGTTSFVYTNNGLTTTSPNGVTYQSNYDPLGQVIDATHSAYGTVRFTRNSEGQTEKVHVGATQVADMRYHADGSQQYLQDPNAGKTQYNYNGFGELLTQTDAQNQVQTHQYADGKLISSQVDNQNTSYLYVPESENGAEQIQQVVSGDIQLNYDYTEDDLVKKRSLHIDGQVFETRYSYDALQRIDLVTYANGIQLLYAYRASDGALEQISMKESSTSTHEQVLVRLLDQNKYGAVTKYSLGNGLESTRLFSSEGLPEVYYTPGVQDYKMEFDPTTGNLLWREDTRYNLRETFGYDTGNEQLTSWKLNNSSQVHHISYSSEVPGNIHTKSDISTRAYVYDENKVHAVGHIAFPSLSRKYHSISYTSQHAPKKITSTSDAGEIEYFYAHTDERVKAKIKRWDGSQIQEFQRYYLGDLERTVYDNVQQDVLRVAFPGIGQVASIVKTNEEIHIHYTYTDHLGTVTKVTDEDGTLEVQQAFDPWGRRRNPQTWAIDESQVNSLPQWMYRGYTGHEMLEDYDLIHMNGRLYDPLVARMLSPDNYVQNPNDPRSYNRFAYAWNNPLKYNDPDGEWVHLVVGAVIGGTFNWAVNGARFDAKGLGYFGVGALAGALGAGIGAGVNVVIAGGSFGAGFAGTATVSSTGFIAGFATGAAGGATNGLISGTGNGMLGGQTFGQAFMQDGLNQAWKQGLSGGIAGGVFGGINAASHDRNFWTGSYKQHDLERALLASNDNMIADEYIFPDDATIANGDNYKVYYKSEDGVTGIKDYVEPGKYIKKSVDGIATSKYTDQVFKIPDGGKVLVRVGGEVEFTNGYGLYETLQVFDRAGWQNSQYFIDRGAYEGWKGLFNAARLWIR